MGGEDKPVIVHGDLKAVSWFQSSAREVDFFFVHQENVLISATGRALLADFGLACIVNEMTTTASSIISDGTLAFKAPELLYSDSTRPAKTTATDVYAFGMLMYQVSSLYKPLRNQTAIRSTRRNNHFIHAMNRSLYSEYAFAGRGPVDPVDVTMMRFGTL